MNDVIKVASIRAIVGGVFAAAVMFCTTWGALDLDPGAKEVILPTVMAFLTYAGPRLLGEGIWDQKRSS